MWSCLTGFTEPLLFHLVHANNKTLALPFRSLVIPNLVAPRNAAHIWRIWGLPYLVHKLIIFPNARSNSTVFPTVATPSVVRSSPTFEWAFWQKTSRIAEQ